MVEETKLEEQQAIQPTSSQELLKVDANELMQLIINESDPRKLKDLTHLFNMNVAKKNMLRVLSLNNLLDKLNDETLNRLNEAPDMISTKDLAALIKAMQGQLTTSYDVLEDFSTKAPSTFQVNQQQNHLNINVNSNLNRDSKEKVVDIVKQLLKDSQESSQPLDVVGVENSVIEENFDEDDD